MRVTEGISDAHLAAVYADPYIARVAHDHRPHEPVIHPLATYYSAWVGDRFAGAFLAIRFSDLEIEVHSLLHRWAVSHSRGLGLLFIAACFADSDVQRLTAYVIGGLRSAANFCKRLGFIHEGMRREACMVGGVLTGVEIYGLTRADWGRV